MQLCKNNNIIGVNIIISIIYNMPVRNSKRNPFGIVVSSKQAIRRAQSCGEAIRTQNPLAGGLCLGFTREQCGLGPSPAPTTPSFTLNSGVYTINLSLNSGSASYAFGCVPVPGTTNEFTYCLLLSNNDSYSVSPSFSVTSNTENTFSNYVVTNSTKMLSVAGGGGGGAGYIYDTHSGDLVWTVYGGNGGSGGNLFYSNVSPLLNNSYSFTIGCGGYGGSVNPYGTISTPGTYGYPNIIQGPANMITTPSTYNVLTTPIPSYTSNPYTSSISNSSTNCTINIAGGNGGYNWNQTLKHDTPGNTAYTINNNTYGLSLITAISGNETYTSPNESSVGSVGNGGQATHGENPYHGCMGISFGLGYDNGSSLQGVLPYIPCFSVSSSTFNNPNSGHPVNFGGGGGGGGSFVNGTCAYAGVSGAYTSSSNTWQQFYEDSSYYYAGSGGSCGTSGNPNAGNGQSGSACNGVPPYFSVFSYPGGQQFYNNTYGQYGGGGGGGGSLAAGVVTGNGIANGPGGIGANGFTLIMWTEVINQVPTNSTSNTLSYNISLTQV